MKNKAFTLVEVLITSIIMVILFGIFAVAVIETRSIFETSDISVILQANTRSSLDKIYSVLRRTNKDRIGIIQNYPVVGSDAIVYCLPRDSDQDGVPDLDNNGNLIWDSTNTTIKLDNGGAHLLQKEVQAGGTEVIASSVKSVNFFDHQRDPALYLDELKVVLGFEKVNTKGRAFRYNSTAIINMRN